MSRVLQNVKNLGTLKIIALQHPYTLRRRIIKKRFPNILKIYPSRKYMVGSMSTFLPILLFEKSLSIEQLSKMP